MCKYLPLHLTSDDFKFLGKSVLTAVHLNTDAFDEYEAMEDHNGDEASKTKGFR